MTSMATPTWQKLIWVVMFMVVCEGAVRKWIFPGLQAEVYFAKDVVLIFAYVGFISSHLSPGVHLRATAGLRVLLLCSLVYFSIQLINPNSPSLILSIVGFKNYLLYTPLAFIVPYMFSSSEDLQRKLRIYAIVMLPFAGLGLVQFSFDPNHWINGYLSHDSEELRIASIFGSAAMEKARTTGTFSYIGGYTTFLSVMFCVGAGLCAGERWRISASRWPLALVVIVIAAMFTTGSRGPIYGLMLTCPLVLYIWASSGLMTAQSILQMGLACVAMYMIIAAIVPDAIEAYQFRTEHSDDPVERVFSPFTELYEMAGQAPLLGTGMASTNAAAITIMGTQDWWWLNGIFAEAETARVLQETGVVGFVLVYAARIWLLVRAITLGVQFKTPLYAAMSGLIAAFFAQYLVVIVINNPTGGIYYWFAAGLLFAMYRLEVQGRTQRA